MEIIISETKQALVKKRPKGAELIRKLSTEGRGKYNVATGASQFEMFKELVKEKIDWSLVTGFHLDEYIGLSKEHPAHFVNTLKKGL